MEATTLESIAAPEMTYPNPHEWVPRFGGPEITFEDGDRYRVSTPGLEGWHAYFNHSYFDSVPIRLQFETNGGRVIADIAPAQNGDVIECQLGFMVSAGDEYRFPAGSEQIASSFWEAVEIVKSWRPKLMEVEGLEFWCRERFGAETFINTIYSVDKREGGWAWEHSIEAPDSVKAWAEISGQYISTQSLCDDGPFETPEQAARLAIQSSRDVAHKIKLAMEPEVEAEDPFSLDDEDPLSASTPFEHVKALHSASQSSYSRGYLAAALAVRQQLQAAGLEAV